MSGLGGGGDITNTEPRIGSLQLQQSSQGVPIQLVWGRNRVYPNLLWFGDFAAIEHRDSQEAGKGGGTTVTNVTYTYTASLLIGLGAGPISGIEAIWRHKDKLVATTKALPADTLNHVGTMDASLRVIVSEAARWAATVSVSDANGLEIPSASYSVLDGLYTFTGYAPGDWVSISYTTVAGGETLSALQVAGFGQTGDGAIAQPVWTYLTVAHADQAIGYSGVAYVAATHFTLGGAAGLPQLSFEVNGRAQVGGGNVDANPADVITDLLTDPVYGAGFPAAQMDSLGAYRAWCAAAGLFVSPVWAERKGVFEYVSQLAKLTHARPLWSVNTLKLVPMTTEALSSGTGSYTPVAEHSTPVYALTDDDFRNPVEETRGAPSDRFNRVSIKYRSRALDYADAVESAEDRASIDTFGLIEAPEVLDASEVASPAVAPVVAELLLREYMSEGGQYRFELPISYDLLEPLDIVQIEDARIDLAPRAVRIIEISEAGDDGALQVVAEDVRVTGSVTQTRQAAGGYSYAGTPPAQAALRAVMMPTAATGNAQQLWLGVTSGDNWGGSSVWVSSTGSGYRRVADVNVRARMGTLASSIASASAELNPAQEVDVLVTGSTTLASVNQVDSDALRSLVWVNGELMSYRDATLTALGRYDLGYLRRALYGTPSPAHVTGDPWLRLEDAIVKIDVPAADLGTTLYVKVTSRNALGTYVQGLEEVSATAVVLTAYPSAPGAVAGLALTAPFVSTYLETNWASAARASDYQVELRDAADVLLRTVYTSAPVFRYLYADALDDGGARRSYTVKVRGRNTGSTGPWATRVVSNPAPAAITGLDDTGTGTSRTLSWTPSTATDLAGYLARYSATAGFDPAAGEGTGFHDGSAFSADLTGLTVGITYYVRVAAFDVWDRDIADLNWSAEHSFIA